MTTTNKIQILIRWNEFRLAKAKSQADKMDAEGKIEDFQFYLRVIEEGKLASMPGLPQTMEKRLLQIPPEKDWQRKVPCQFCERLPALRTGQRLVTILPRREKTEKLGMAAGSARQTRATAKTNASAILTGQLSPIRNARNQRPLSFLPLLPFGKNCEPELQKGNGKHASRPSRNGLGRKRLRRYAAFARA